jgi:diadenosine tetraphosphate (Ap4A) HIT family hydrolase
MNCPYCVITDPEQKIILRNDFALFIQDERYQGALKHSGVIVPINHRTTVFDLTEDELLATFRLLKAVKDWMDQQYHPDGYNIGWNNGLTAGQQIPHVHMHVMPRFSKEPLAGKGIRALLKSDENKW